MIILFLNEHNHNENSFVSKQRKMSEAAIPISDFDVKFMEGTKTFRKFLQDISTGVRFYKTAVLQLLYLLKRTLFLKKILTIMLKF